MAPSRNRGKRRKTIPRQSSPSSRESVKEVRQEISESHDHLVICWHVGKIDWDGPWGMRACRNIDFRRLVDETISNWETMTWAELYQASGGRRRGTNHHPILVSKLSSTAKKRLKDIEEDDIETIVSLRINSRERLYGIRAGQVFEVLWYDPWHDNRNKAVCPTRR